MLICVGNLTIISSDNGLSPDRCQAIIWNNAGILLIGPLGTNFSEISIKIITFSFKKMRSKVSSGKRRPSCLGLNVLNIQRAAPLSLLSSSMIVRRDCSRWSVSPCDIGEFFFISKLKLIGCHGDNIFITGCWMNNLPIKWTCSTGINGKKLSHRLVSVEEMLL